MIAQARLGQGQDGRGEEHGLIVGVGDEQTDAFVTQAGELAAGHGDGVQPGRDEDNGDAEQGV